MKSTALIMAVLGIMAGTVWAVPTYQYSGVDLGDGFYGVTFTVDNPGQPPSAWFVEMEWRGLSQAEADQQCWPGALPGTINQLPAGGFMPVHCETEAWDYDVHDPNYDMSRDTWIKSEFCFSCQSGTPIEGPNSFRADCGTVAGMQYVTVEHAYIVVDGSFAYEGRVGVGLVDPVWTPVSGVICIPGPAALPLLAIGGLGLLCRKRGRGA